jgi:hypothetical protein
VGQQAHGQQAVGAQVEHAGVQEAGRSRDVRIGGQVRQQVAERTVQLRSGSGLLVGWARALAVTAVSTSAESGSRPGRRCRPGGACRRILATAVGGSSDAS